MLNTGHKSECSFIIPLPEQFDIPERAGFSIRFWIRFFYGQVKVIQNDSNPNKELQRRLVFMIRMGRSSKTEPQTSSAPESYQGQSTNSSFQQTNEVSGGRITSDSEAMARDIKDGRLSGFIGHGTVLTGEASFQAMLRIDGHLTGQIMSESGTLIVGATGKVDANIIVAAAVINGTVNGDIIVSEKLEFGRTARVIGNVQTPRLLIEDGAVFEGGCTMLKAKEAIEKRDSEMNSQSSADKFSAFQVNGYDERDLTGYEADTEENKSVVS